MQLSTGYFPAAASWTARAAVSSALIVLTAGVALGILGTYEYANEYELLTSHGLLGQLVAVIVAVFTIGVFWCSRYLATRDVPLSPTWYVLALLVGGAAIHLLLIDLVKPAWGTDHLRYWEYAQRLVEQGKYGGMDRPYYARSLFVPYPIVRFFGPEAAFALKLANAALLGFIQMALYDVMRRHASHQIAQAASLLLLAAPLPAYAILIPSHDLWGLFFLTLAFWFFSYALSIAQRAKPVAIAWVALAVATGLLAYIAEVQRTVGLIFCVSALLATVLTSVAGAVKSDQRRRPIIPVVIALICLGSYFAADLVDERVKLRAEARPVLINMKFSANAGGMGNGKSDWFARFRSRFSEGYTTPERTSDLVKASGLSSWAIAPLDRAGALAVHSKRLFGMTYPRDWNWMLRKPQGISDRTREILIFYSDTFGFLFGLLLLAATLKLAIGRQAPPLILTTGAIFIVTLALPLLLLFENKPYNIFPIWLVGAMIVGSTMANKAILPADRLASARSVIFNPGLGGAALLVFAGLLAHYVIKASYTESDGRLLADWSLATNQDVTTADRKWEQMLLDARPEAFDVNALEPLALDEMYLRSAHEDGDRIARFAGHTVTRMEFPLPYKPGDVLELSTLACTSDSGRNWLEFFVYAPNTGELDSPDLLLDVSVDGRDSNDFAVPFRGRSFQRFILRTGLSDSTCHDISFRLQSTAPARSDDASFVEIWMPRLIPAS